MTNNFGEKLHCLKSQKGDIFCSALSNNGQFIVSGADDEALQIYNGVTGKEIRILEVNIFVQL